MGAADRRTAPSWPEDWADRVRGKDCPMCAEGRPEESRDGRRIHAGSVSDTYLKRARIVRGYAIVVWRGRHVAEPTELMRDEAVGYWLDVLQVAAAIEARYRPLKLNLLMLGNLVPHLHTHVVPRYLDDPDAGAPPRSMMTEGAAPPMDEDEYTQQVESLRALLTS